MAPNLAAHHGTSSGSATQTIEGAGLLGTGQVTIDGDELTPESLAVVNQVTYENSQTWDYCGTHTNTSHDTAEFSFTYLGEGTSIGAVNGVATWQWMGFIFVGSYSVGAPVSKLGVITNETISFSIDGTVAGIGDPSMADSFLDQHNIDMSKVPFIGMTVSANGNGASLMVKQDQSCPEVDLLDILQ